LAAPIGGRASARKTFLEATKGFRGVFLLETGGSGRMTVSKLEPREHVIRRALFWQYLDMDGEADRCSPSSHPAPGIRCLAPNAGNGPSHER